MFMKFDRPGIQYEFLFVRMNSKQPIIIEKQQ